MNKIADVQETTSHPMQRALRARADHLMAFESTTPGNPAYQNWVDVRMQRWIVDSMLRSGRFEAAQTLSNDLGIDVSHWLSVFTHYLNLFRRLWLTSLSLQRFNVLRTL